MFKVLKELECRFPSRLRGAPKRHEAEGLAL